MAQSYWRECFCRNVCNKQQERAGIFVQIYGKYWINSSRNFKLRWCYMGETRDWRAYALSKVWDKTTYNWKLSFKWSSSYRPSAGRLFRVKVTRWTFQTLQWQSSSYVALQLFMYRVLAFSTNSFHFPLSWTRVFQFGTFDFCIFFLVSSTQRVLCLPIRLLEIGFQEYTAFTILVSCILSKSSSQLILCARMKFNIFLRFINSFSSWLVFIRHIPFSFFGPNIFLRILLSNTNSLLIIVSFSIHVSHEYVTIGLIT